MFCNCVKEKSYGDIEDYSFVSILDYHNENIVVNIKNDKTGEVLQEHIEVWSFDESHIGLDKSETERFSSDLCQILFNVLSKKYKLGDKLVKENVK